MNAEEGDTSVSPAKSNVVVQVGPALDETGGMATVCRQMVELNFAGLFRVMHFATTRGLKGRETFPGRVVRHVRHVRALRKCIEAHQVRVVHIHTCSGFSFYRSAVDAWAARRAGCRVVMHIHGAGFDRFCAQASRAARYFIRQSLESSDAVIALSRSWAGAIGKVAPKARIIVVENSVPDAAVCDRGESDRPCHFLLLARMDVWKGVDDMLAACAKLKNRQADFRVTLAGPVGDTECSGDLASRIDAADLAGCVRYVGEVAGESKEALWGETDVLVQPSHQEGMPMAMLEALMRGIPVVATRVGAIPEVITDGREGLLIAPRTVDELAAAMQKMIDDPGARREMGRAAGELARQRFTLKRFERDLTGTYWPLMEVDSRARVVGYGSYESADPTECDAHQAVAAAN